MKLLIALCLARIKQKTTTHFYKMKCMISAEKESLVATECAAMDMVEKL